MILTYRYERSSNTAAAAHRTDNTLPMTIIVGPARPAATRPPICLWPSTTTQPACGVLSSTSDDYSTLQVPQQARAYQPYLPKHQEYAF